MRVKPYFQTELGKLYHGDCLEIMPRLEYVDMILTDPPYGITACEWDNIIPLKSMWIQLERIIKNNNAIIIMANQPFTTMLISSNMKIFKYCWIWEKDRPSNPLLAKIQPMRYTEDIVVFYKNRPIYNYIMETKNPKNIRTDSRGKGETSRPETLGNKTILYGGDGSSLMCYPHNIQKFSKVQKGVHPTQKPVKLMEYLIKTYTNENEIVLDFTIGGGTTAIACERLNRRWIGIEISKEYCDIAVDRIKKETAQLKLSV